MSQNLFINNIYVFIKDKGKFQKKNGNHYVITIDRYAFSQTYFYSLLISSVFFAE